MTRAKQNGSIFSCQFGKCSALFKSRATLAGTSTATTSIFSCSETISPPTVYPSHIINTTSGSTRYMRQARERSPRRETPLANQTSLASENYFAQSYTIALSRQLARRHLAACPHIRRHTQGAVECSGDRLTLETLHRRQASVRPRSTRP